jgi:hypothetical protein
MRTVTIPGGNAALREKHEIRQRHRRLVEIASVAAAPAIDKVRKSLPTGASDEDAVKTLEAMTDADLHLTKQEAQALCELQDAHILATLVSWSLDTPVPTDEDSLGDIDPEVYDALAQALKGELLGTKVDFDPGDPRRPDFKDSPTSPSDDSASVLRAKKEYPSTGPLPSDGTSIDTGPASLASPTSST